MKTTVRTINSGLRSFINRKRTKFAGYTLTELLVVLVIMGCIGAVAIPAYNGYIARGRTARIGAVVDAVATAKQLYLADPLRTTAEITGWASATEADRLTALTTGTNAPGLNIQGVAVSTIAELTAGTGETTLTIGAANEAPKCPADATPTPTPAP